MKKLLVAISLLLVVATVMAVPAFGAKAVDVEDLKYNVGQPVHYVGKPTTKAPVQDGTINKGEYSYTYRYEKPIYMCDSSLNEIPSTEYADHHSDYIEISYSYDDKYVYVAVFDDMFYTSKNNMVHNVNTYFRLGLNMENPYSFLQVGVVNNGDPGAVKGIETENNDAKVAVSSTVNRARTKDGAIYQQIPSGYVIKSGSVNEGITSVYEFKYDKEAVVALSNSHLGTDYDEFPNAFYFTAYMRQFADSKREGPETYTRWFGKKLTNTDRLTLGTTQTFIPEIVVLGEKGAVDVEDEETTAATTEAVTTAPETTKAPETTVPETTKAPETTEAPVTTEAPATTETPVITTDAETEAPAKKGCKSSVSVAGIALVAALGTCATVIRKRKED